jgi:hypothetical protein
MYKNNCTLLFFNNTRRQSVKAPKPQRPYFPMCQAPMRQNTNAPKGQRAPTWVHTSCYCDPVKVCLYKSCWVGATHWVLQWHMKQAVETLRRSSNEQVTYWECQHKTKKFFCAYHLLHMSENWWQSSTKSVKASESAKVVTHQKANVPKHQGPKAPKGHCTVTRRNIISLTNLLPWKRARFQSTSVTSRVSLQLFTFHWIHSVFGILFLFLILKREKLDWFLSQCE